MTMASEFYTIPTKFFRDHRDRDLPTPAIAKSLAKRYVIARDDPALPELIADAEYYADPVGFDPLVQQTVCRAAQALLRAIATQSPCPVTEEQGA